eukprot:TRINITY_DN42009_c0_g1_i1.p1 TRINITY_DN42009_c0_g1~~TRINITY_DN42009_c0_g1_i1.p1  ORF type:complete len:980 (+),score=227.17 TRINITY_DN42009_c0_g1_i1:79-3018(+)
MGAGSDSEQEQAQRTWEIDEQVLCKGQAGVIRFIGETQFAAGTWIGIETTAAAGTHDGAVDGIRYFGPTAEKHGIFLRPTSKKLQKFSSEEAAALKLQGQFRRKRDSDEHHYTQACRALNELESKSESDRLRASMTCAMTVKLLEAEVARNKGPPTADVTPRPAEKLPDAKPAVPTIKLEFGDRLSVTRECVDDIYKHLKKCDAEPIAADCVLRLIRASMDIFRQEYPCALNEIALPPAPGQCVIVGDTHGQFEDVLWLFFEHGEPSPSNVYLFNGDVTDRGSSAAEILILLLLFKLWDPTCVHMNRGNHEDPTMNEFYGFYDECVAKYGKAKGGEVFDAFNQLFHFLPLYCVVDKGVFVVHGGLFRKHFTLNQLRRVDHRKGIPITAGSGLDTALFDSMWSDPSDHNGIGSNSRGDEIVTFGPDVTRRFLRENKFRLLVRSHQLPDNGSGYEWNHDFRCLTVFSASNYCGDCGNLGSVLILSEGDDDMIIEHYAPSKKELADYESEADTAFARLQAQAKCLKAQRKMMRTAQDRMEKDIMKRVSELVVKHKADLFEYWSEVDESPRGMFRISAALWREGCATILDEALPWKRLQDIMGVLDVEPSLDASLSSGGLAGGAQVNYVKFLSKYRVAYDADYGLAASGWENAVWSRLMETLLRADLPLREALAALDSTHDGLVSGVEFGKLLENCHVGLTPMQARYLLRAVISNPGDLGDSTASDGGIAGRASVWDVLGRLQMSLPVSTEDASGKAVSQERQTESAWAVPKLKALATAVLEDATARLKASGEEWPVSKLLAAWFEDMDTSANGFLEFPEFETALRSIKKKLEFRGCPADKDSLARLARYCDVLGNGRVNYFELLNSLTWEDSVGESVKQDLMESVHAGIYFNAAAIRTAFHKLDETRCGTVSQDGFTSALKTVGAVLQTGRSGLEGGQLLSGQLDAIAQHLPKEADGTINYETFLASFRIVDMTELPRTKTG